MTLELLQLYNRQNDPLKIFSLRWTKPRSRILQITVLSYFFFCLFQGTFPNFSPLFFYRQYETVVPLEDSVVTEVTATLQEWAVLWKQLYVVRAVLLSLHISDTVGEMLPAFVHSKPIRINIRIVGFLVFNGGSPTADSRIMWESHGLRWKFQQFWNSAFRSESFTVIKKGNNFKVLLNM